MDEKQVRAYLITINNPVEHGYSRDVIIDIVRLKFRHVIFWCMCDEVGKQSGTYHTHIFILLEKKKRWSAVQRAFQGAHIDIVRGTPQQAADYVRKSGKWADSDKEETNLKQTYYEEGKMPTYYASENRKEMLETIERMIDDGLTPEQIFAESIIFRQAEAIIRKQFFAKRFRETPPLRDVRVIYHLGASGSGKSYSYVKLCEEYGADEVYFASDFANKCTALLDGYEAQKILFIDEVKLDDIPYGFLLQLLQGYCTPIHARYANVFSLWQEIHITSIFTPHELYEGMVSVNSRSVDSEEQLLRRIHFYSYHWKDGDTYREIKLPASELVGKAETLAGYMREKAKGNADVSKKL